MITPFIDTSTQKCNISPLDHSFSICHVNCVCICSYLFCLVNRGGLFWFQEHALHWRALKIGIQHLSQRDGQLLWFALPTQVPTAVYLAHYLCCLVVCYVSLCGMCLCMQLCVFVCTIYVNHTPVGQSPYSLNLGLGMEFK